MSEEWLGKANSGYCEQLLPRNFDWFTHLHDTKRKQGNGYVFTVTLSRINKKTSQKDSVRLEPHPPYISPTALEARHWGATYALYRVRGLHQRNGILAKL